MDIEIYRKFFGSIAKPQRSGKVFSNCESVPPIDGDTVTNRYPMQSGHEAMTVRTPIQSPDMAEAESSRGTKRINTLDENITETADSGIKKRVRIDTRLDEMSTPESTSFKLTEVEDKPATAHSETLTDGNTFTRN
ncbi:MAG: hypothetical protein IJG36_08330 [Synergistaceae bacterium]|nr:hypothetical protein [Synergistaceae bacterium]